LKYSWAFLLPAAENFGGWANIYVNIESHGCPQQPAGVL
jgi:hypothetical protein